MYEEIAAYRGYCEWLIESMAACPCNNPNPITVTCSYYTLIPPLSISRPRPRRRARARSRRRRSRTIRGRSSEPSDGDGSRPRNLIIHAGWRTPPCR
jgi:hypothetical protein